MKFSRRNAIAAIATASVLVTAGSVWAQDNYPNKPISLVVAFAPGGISDTLTRFFASEMEKKLGSPVVVENKPGAGGTIGPEYVARSAPDGYTLQAGGGSSYTPAMIKAENLRFNMFEDFTPISLTALFPTVVMVRADLPVNTLQELIDYAKANPGKLNYGSSGANTTLYAEHFAHLAGIEITRVAYQGNAPLVLGMLSGETDMVLDPPLSYIGHLREGKFRALATAADERFSLLPDVPTTAEAGLPGAIYMSNQGFWAPKGTPDAITDKLNQVMVEICTDPATAKLFAEQFGAVPVGSTRQELVDYIRKDQEFLGEAAQIAGYVPL